MTIDSLQRRVATAEQLTLALEPLVSRIASVEQAVAQDRVTVVDTLESLRLQHETRIAAVERAIPESLQPMAARLEERIAAVERAIPESLQPMAARLEDRIAQDRVAVVDALESLRLEHETMRNELETAQKRPPKLLDALSEVYGTPPTLRTIPGWHTYWGLENGSNGFLRDRAKLWSSLKKPVLMRWLGDLLVMIWPGNELSRVLFLTGNFEPNELTWLSQTLTEGMTMIDVGAHIGMYTLTASKLVGESGVVVALEPSTREFQRLTFHVNLNDLRNVRCLQVAGSSVSGEATLKIASEWNSGHNTFGEFFNPEVETIREERVLTQTLDAVVSAQKLERVDLIKIDVEGHEPQVLAGAVETLTRFRPRVLIEVFEETLRHQGASVEGILGFLTGHDYALYEFSDINGGLVPLSRSPGNDSRNLVALPR